MRELHNAELDQVNGGFLPLVFGGMAVSGLTSYLSGDSPRVVLASTILGGLGGGSASMAKAATGAIMKAKWAIQGSGLTVANGTISSASGSGGGLEGIETQEIEVAK
tara:strand:- start:52 stop:372 length:321 start_codon:yes stop_codon:yes gene_type:complete